MVVTFSVVALEFLFAFASCFWLLFASREKWLIAEMSYDYISMIDSTQTSAMATTPASSEAVMFVWCAGWASE
jgi:hypothetical protein